MAVGINFNNDEEEIQGFADVLRRHYDEDVTTFSMKKSKMTREEYIRDVAKRNAALLNNFEAVPRKDLNEIKTILLGASLVMKDKKLLDKIKNLLKKDYFKK